MNRRASRILTVCAGAWLLVIWGHSCLPAAQSGAESGALLVVVQDLLPWMTDHVLRKCAHFAEYAVLGALTAAALRTSAHFSWPRALLPGPFAALCDETIQLFVPGRSGRIADVWLDTAGYLTGALLTLLMSDPGRLFSREEIYSRVWGEDVVVGDRTIDVHIRKLRQKIGDEHIITVKGVGYKYEK